MRGLVSLYARAVIVASHSFCPLCSGEPLARQVVSALDRKWHPGCFVCQECKKPFDGGLFFKVDGKPFCSEHALDVDEDDCEYSGESGEDEESAQ